MEVKDRRAVVDTCVVVDGLNPGNRAETALVMGMLSGKLTPVVNKQTQRELLYEVSSRNKTRWGQFVWTLIKACFEIVPVVLIKERVVDDKGDHKIVEAAVAGKVPIISNDRTFQRAKGKLKKMGVQVYTPEEFEISD